MSIRVSLRVMLRLIWIDTLRRVHNVGFLEGWLIHVIKDPFTMRHFPDTLGYLKLKIAEEEYVKTTERV